MPRVSTVVLDVVADAAIVDELRAEVRNLKIRCKGAGGAEGEAVGNAII